MTWKIDLRGEDNSFIIKEQPAFMSRGSTKNYYSPERFSFCSASYPAIDGNNRMFIHGSMEDRDDVRLFAKDSKFIIKMFRAMQYFDKLIVINGRIKLNA